MENRERHTLTLRIMGDAVDPQRTSEILGLTPSFIGIKGTRMGKEPRPGTNPRRAVFQTNIWNYAFCNDCKPFEQSINEFLDLLKPISEKWAIVTSLPDIDVELFLGYFGTGSGQGGLFLSHNTISRLSQFKLDLTFDLYV